MRWTSLIGTGLRAKLWRRTARLADTAHWQRNTAKIQAGTLRSLLTTAQGTEMGRTAGFARIAAISDPAHMLRAYREAVPIGDWYTIRDRVARMRENAEPDVLWPGLVGHFAQTSGTTAGDKFIPVTRAMFKSNYRASLDIFAYLLGRGVPLERVMAGRCLFLGGSSDLKTDANGIITADLSGLVTPLIRWPLSQIYAPGPEIALISDWPKKIERMAEATIDQDIRFISGMPSWTHVLMVRVLELARQRGRDARCIRDVWPNLDIVVHGGVRYTPFERRIGEVLTGDPAGDFTHRHELYPASEGFIAMQDHAGQPGMRLNADHGIFYEFVPTEAIAEDGSIPAGAPAFTPDATEPGVRYGVVMTTCAGLWRYHIGDVVEFENTPADLDGHGGNGPARLRIVGRHRHFINAFGENLIVEHIEQAVATAADTAAITIGEFTAAPVYPSETRRAGLELVIELPGALPEHAMKDFANAFDASLKSQNVDYATKRTDDLGMAPPTITPLPPGSFHRWMASRGKLGGQHKCPRCANHREYIDGLRDAERPKTKAGATSA
jgi:hypothetical protein